MKKAPEILIINGPNLNMLGKREPEIYGRATLKDVEKLCRETAASCGLAADCRQSNCEGDIVTWIQESADYHKGIVINAGAYTHTSIAIYDAIKTSRLPVVEVHVSNIFARESFRRQSFISPAAAGVISGLGIAGYEYAVRHLATLIAPKRKKKS